MKTRHTSTELLTAAVQGSFDARSELISVVSQFAVKRALECCRYDYEIAEAAAQEALLKVDRAIISGGFKGTQSGAHHFHAFVAKVVSRCVCDELRKKEKKVSREISLQQPVSREEQTSYLDLLSEENASPQEEAEKSESKEQSAWCFAIMMRSIDLVRQNQLVGQLQDDEVILRELGWQGFMDMVLNGKDRNSVIKNLLDRSPSAQSLQHRLNPDWLSRQANRIRNELYTTFIKLGKLIARDMSEEDLTTYLSTLASAAGYHMMAQALRTAMRSDQVAIEDKIAALAPRFAEAIDPAFKKTKEEAVENRKLSSLATQLTSQVTRLSR